MMMTDGSELNAYFRFDIEIRIKVKSHFNYFFCFELEQRGLYYGKKLILHVQIKSHYQLHILIDQIRDILVIILIVLPIGNVLTMNVFYIITKNNKHLHYKKNVITVKLYILETQRQEN